MYAGSDNDAGESPGESALVVGGSRLFRELLGRVLNEAGIATVLGTADAAEGIECFLRCSPDVVLLDGSSEAGVATARALSARSESPCMIAVEVRPNGIEVFALAAAGVRGFVTSDCSVADLVHAIAAVAGGSAACPPQVASALLTQVASNGPVAVPEPERLLTRRELDVLELMRHGLANKQIARALSIELPTVKNHVHHILTKLDLSNRAEVGAWARRHPRLPAAALVE